MKRRVNILVPTLNVNDATGNDTTLMCDVLKRAGYDAQVWAEHIHGQMSHLARPLKNEREPELLDPDSLLIYHQAIFWELGEKLLAHSRSRVVIKYHNVTPPHFFAGHGPNYYWACVKGKEANLRLCKLPNVMFWCDSVFNSNEVLEYGVPPERCRLLPPLHMVEEFSRETFDSEILGEYRGQDTFNILFVGSLRPNKGHAKAIEIIGALTRICQKPVRLVLAGSFDPTLTSYFDDLQHYVKHLGLTEEVHFARGITPAALRSYYLAASAFLCVSEHEGFCVPLVEAMAFRVPMVVWNTTAVGETAGGCGLIFDDYDAEDIAEGLNRLCEDPVLVRDFATQGRHRYEQVFRPDVIERKLVELTKEMFTA